MCGKAYCLHHFTGVATSKRTSSSFIWELLERRLIIQVHTRMIKALENIPHSERQEEFNLFSLTKEPQHDKTLISGSLI